MSSFKTVSNDYTITCYGNTTVAGSGYLYVNAIFSVPSLIVANLVANNGVFNGNVTSQGLGNGFIGTLLTNAQPNITSLGNLTSLTVTPGVSTLANVVAGNLTATGSNLGAINIENNVIGSAGDIILDPQNDGGLFGNVVIYGNLQVEGNVTTIDSNTISINSLLFQAANNATSNTLASGGGLAVGPAGASYASWTYNQVANVWQSDLGGSFAGNINALGEVLAGNLSAAGAVIYGNVTAANFLGTASTLSGNLNASGAVLTGNVTADNFLGTAATISGNATAANFISNGNISAGGTLNVTGNATTGNLTTGTLVATNFSAGNIVLTSPLTVSSGGTGLSSLNTGYIPYGNGAGALKSVSTFFFDGANLGVGTTTPAYTLDVTGTANISGNTAVFSLGIGTPASGLIGEIRAANNVTAFYASDSRFKENILPITNAVEKAVAIGGKTFDWTDKYISEHGGEDGYFVTKQDIGVIAQDVQQVLPQAVRTRQDGSLAVDYAKLSALAFAAIAELKAEIEVLKGKQ